MDLFYNPIAKLDISVGYNFQAITHVLDQANLPAFGIPFIPYSLADDDDIVTTALFAQATYSITDSLRIVAGVRLESQLAYDSLGESYNTTTSVLTKAVSTYDEEDLEVIPRIAAIYEINQNHIIKFLYGEAINRPSFSQNQFSDKTRPALAPEFITTYEVNYLGVITPQVSANISIFHNELEDLITRTDVPLANGTFTNFSSNSGIQNTTGVELIMSAKPVDNLNLDFSVTYQETKDGRKGFEDMRVAYSPNWLAKFKTAYKHKQMTFSLIGNYVSDIKPLWQGPPPSLSATGRRDGPEVDSRFLLAANFRYDNVLAGMIGPGLYTNLKITNLLDDDFLYPAASFNFWADKGLPGENRMVMLTVGMEFK